MAEVRIEISEQELRKQYVDHVNRVIKVKTLAEILKDEQFRREVIENHLGSSAKSLSVPVNIQVR